MKKLLSIVLVFSVLFSMFAFSTIVNADTAETGYTEIGLLDFEDESKVGEGKFVEYGTSSNEALREGDYKKGSSTAPIALVTDEEVHGGKYALKYYNRSASNHRIKLAHIIPDDISSYVGRTLKVSGYVYLVGDASVGKIKISLMDDLGYDVFTSTTVNANPNEWTYTEITLDLTDAHIVTENNITYPMRVGVEQEADPYAATMYMDNFKAEISEKNKTLYAEQGFETKNTSGTHFNGAGSPAPTVSLNEDTAYVKTGSYSAKAVTTDANGGLRIRNVMDSIVCSDNVGKTFKITSYLMPVYEQGTLTDDVYAANLEKLAFRLSVARTADGLTNGSVYKFGIKNNEWNKLTMLYTVTENAVTNDYDSLRFDQYMDDASWDNSVILCPTFYVDDIVVEEYKDFYTPSMTLYKEESFETADEKFAQYGTSTYTDLTNSANEYKMGGQYYN